MADPLDVLRGGQGQFAQVEVAVPQKVDGRGPGDKSRAARKRQKQVHKPGFVGEGRGVLCQNIESGLARARPQQGHSAEEEEHLDPSRVEGQQVHAPGTERLPVGQQEMSAQKNHDDDGRGAMEERHYVDSRTVASGRCKISGRSSAPMPGSSGG